MITSGKPECKVCVVLGTPCSYESKGLKRGPPKGFRSGPKESAKARLLRNLETTIRDLAQQMGNEDSALEIARISRHRGLELPTTDAQIGAKRVKISKSDSSDRGDADEAVDGEEEDFLGISEQGSIRHFGSSSGIQLLHTQSIPPPHSNYRPSALRDDSRRSRARSHGSPAPYPLPTIPSRLHNMASSTSHSNSPVQSPNQSQHMQLPLTDSPSKRQISMSLNRKLFYSYWEGFHPFWPVLYKPAFDELSIDHLPSLLDEALINAIYAIAVCVASPTLAAEIELEIADAPAGEVFFHRAERHLFAGHSTPTPSLSSIQVCFFLALYCQGSGELSKAWIYSSLANSMAFDLGLHRHLRHYDDNLIEKESRVRLIHCVYIVSTILSAEMGRPPMMRSKDIDVPLLSEQEKDENELDAMGGKLCVASCLNGGVRLFSIVETVLGQVHSFRRKAALRKMGSNSTNRVVEEIGQRLDAWRLTLPDILKLSSDRKRGDRLLPSFIALHLWYHTAVLLLNRPFIPHEEGSSLQEVLSDPFHAKCTKASNELFELLLQLSNSNNVDRLSTDLAYCIFTAAVMFLFNARLGPSNTSNDGDPAARNDKEVNRLANNAKMQFLMCKEWLRSLSDRWPAASAHKQLLDGFSSVGEDALRGTTSAAQTERSDSRSTWTSTATSAPILNETRVSKGEQAYTSALDQRVAALPGVEQNNAFVLDRLSNDAPAGLASTFGAAFPGGDSQYMYYPSNQAMSQAESAYSFAPNIFDMESVYWNETAARNPASSEASMGLNNAVQQQRLQQIHPPAFSNGPYGNNVITSDGQSQDGSNTANLQQDTNRLQMLAQATTGEMQQVSPFSFHQEPSQPEWNDVISMLQLPPAFLQ